jgi:tRNA (mo5U34)-methyltransferase
MDKDFFSAVQLNNKAVLYHFKGKIAESDTAHKECLSLLEQNSQDVRRFVAVSLANRAALYRTMHEFHEAERLFQQAIHIWERLGWPQNEEMKYNLEESSSNSNIEMLWAEVIEEDGKLRFFGREVQKLRNENSETLRKAIDKLGPWYQDFELMPGLSTNVNNRESVLNKWRFVEPFIPKDLNGKTVLDIGCNSGFFSFEMKKKNAARVVAIDIMPHCLAQTRFLSHWFNHAIEIRQMDVYNVDTLGEFDFVVFFGVLYHLKHPLYALEKVSSICKDTMYLHSLLHGNGDYEAFDDYEFGDRKFFDHEKFPRMYFIEKSFNNDQSNWWVPNRSCLKAMVRVAGFQKIEDSRFPEIIICRKLNHMNGPA